MATATAFGIGGWEPHSSIAESGLNYAFSSLFADDEQDRAQENSQYNAALQYHYAQKYSENEPTWIKTGLEKAGVNPLLYFGQSPSISSPALASAHSSGSLTSASNSNAGVSGNPLMIASAKQDLAFKKSCTDAQQALADLYKANAKRANFIPITESDNGGVSVFGTGFNTGGTDTLLFDLDNGAVIRPKNNSAKSVENNRQRTEDIKFNVPR